jgi:hypothetical protein
MFPLSVPIDPDMDAARRTVTVVLAMLWPAIDRGTVPASSRP